MANCIRRNGVSHSALVAGGFIFAMFFAGALQVAMSAGATANITSGAVLDQSEMSRLQEQTAKAITSARSQAVEGCGLLGATGGIHLAVNSSRSTNEVLIPIPQLDGCQVPVTFGISVTPPETLVECRLVEREGSNRMARVRLKGASGQKIQISWSSVILIAPQAWLTNQDSAIGYYQATGCVESDDKQIRELAGGLWPADGNVATFASNIQEYIRNLKMKKHARSLDALMLLESGVNTICTANANFAAALLRAKRIPARTLAVIPPTGQRLEMHRVVEYFAGGQWQRFDPSMVYKDVPLQPWQSIVVAHTTLADENTAMVPRMGTMVGCPYGQEAELSDSSISLYGNDFLWTLGKPLARFDADDAAVAAAVKEWNRFWETGKESPAQIKAATATNAVAFGEALREK